MGRLSWCGCARSISQSVLQNPFGDLAPIAKTPSAAPPAEAPPSAPKARSTTTHALMMPHMCACAGEGRLQGYIIPSLLSCAACHRMCRLFSCVQPPVLTPAHRAIPRSVATRSPHYLGRSGRVCMLPSLPFFKQSFFGKFWMPLLARDQCSISLTCLYAASCARAIAGGPFREQC